LKALLKSVATVQKKGKEIIYGKPQTTGKAKKPKKANEEKILEKYTDHVNAIIRKHEPSYMD
jgi:hypothetical protein